MNADSPVRLAIFASGNGLNAEAIITYFHGREDIVVAILLSNNPDAPALSRAEKLGIPARVFNRFQFTGSNEVLGWLRQYGVTHIVLAGFLWRVPESLIRIFPGKVINIHPALLPKFGGKGMYGMNVHKAVKASGERETGISIHIVNEHFDEGEILFQARCEVAPSDTPEEIARKVRALEHTHYPVCIEQWARGDFGA